MVLDNGELDIWPRLVVRRQVWFFPRLSYLWVWSGAVRRRQCSKLGIMFSPFRLYVYRGRGLWFLLDPSGFGQLSLSLESLQPLIGVFFFGAVICLRLWSLASSGLHRWLLCCCFYKLIVDCRWMQEEVDFGNPRFCCMGVFVRTYDVQYLGLKPIAKKKQ